MKKELKEIKKAAIKHYKKMIKWAKKQDPHKIVLETDMKKAIGEDWHGSSCPYCLHFNAIKTIYICWRCPLSGGPDDSCCCGRLWHDLNASHYWGLWVKNAKEVLKYIKKHG